MSEEPSVEDSVAAVQGLLTYFEDRIKPALQTLADPEDRVIQVALLARAVPLTQATLKLAREGYGREAMMLNRASFELTLDALWAAADRERAKEHFVAFARLTQQLQKDLAAKWPEMEISPGDEALDPGELAELKRRFGKFADRGWTGMGVKARLDSLMDDFDESQRRGWTFAFEVVQHYNNAELHPSSWSLARALRRVPLPGGGHRLQFRPAQEPEVVPFALRVAWWTFLQHLDSAREMLGLSEEDLEAVAEQGAIQLGMAEPEG